MIDAAYGEWLARGEAHQQAGQPIDAMLCFREAVAVNRHAVVAQSHLGEVLSTLRLRNDAISAWRAALSMQPRHVPSLLAIADELRRSGAYADAVAFYRRALEVEANHPDPRSGGAQRFADIATLIATGSTRVVPWDELARLGAASPPSPSRSLFLERIEALPDGTAPAPMLALAVEEAVGRGRGEHARALIDRVGSSSEPVGDPEVLRRLALAASGSASQR